MSRSSSYAREMTRDLQALARDFGADLSIDFSRRHWCAQFALGGATRCVFVPKTPSDRRSHLNTLSDARRALRVLLERESVPQ